MIDPLQNLLHCADMIINSRKCGNPWLAILGEMDHVCEIQAQMIRLSVSPRAGEQP